MSDLGGRFNLLLRVFELSAEDMELATGWPAEAGRYAGAIRAPWPTDRKALELEVAARPGEVQTSQVETAVRRLIPWLVKKLVTPEEAGGPALVVRVDGRFQPGGVLSALGRIDPTHTSLFHFTGAERLSPAERLPAASLSFLASADVLEQLVLDKALALRRALRLRVFALPKQLAPILISCQSLEDERLGSLLPQLKLYVSPSASVESLFLVGPRDSLELRVRLGMDDTQNHEQSS